jgi:O-antigen/teichoic acid export membrane protein
VPGAVALIGLAPWLLGVFGPGYADGAALALALLALSILAVAPATIYLSLLRARDRGRSLVAYPLAMLAALAVLAPLGAHWWGVTGVAAAWLVANVPFGAWAAHRLHAESREVRTDGSALVGGRAHAE